MTDSFLEWKTHGHGPSHLHPPFSHADCFTAICGIRSGALNGGDIAERSPKCSRCTELAPEVLRRESERRETAKAEWVESGKRSGLISFISGKIHSANSDQLEEIKRILERQYDELPILPSDLMRTQ